MAIIPRSSPTSKWRPFDAVSSPARIEPHPFLRCGERVRVTRAVWKVSSGILVRKKSLYRLVLSVEMLAQSVAVEINATDVEPVKAKNFVNLLPPEGGPREELSGSGLVSAGRC